MLSTPPSACRATRAGWNRGHQQAGTAHGHDGELALLPGPQRGRLLVRRGSGSVPSAQRLLAEAWVWPASGCRR
ncbi:hypothetical protein BDA96_01G332400 [Sorghum bicolor]|uniref:Uncharacterized protein n=2 Tax=Sorghum bicolor TaxID=4558 RepID=A0A921S2L0_SORBI|nr:hypothetical protein BDA96_01G332400 [Sorghum bicolor]KAG0550369.1 hypothetical protein BDA96_01G332400 [Sorghum bicolor]KAG0550370.1 hypothetical protein BDA96_01G332400 [Sorghum bicolor]KAG0550371.1 hypothetical protein BDA96_01G332400 [Sorghum bicolor]KAG0550372.1 hypothetical protein BDA96_01G332400 [Sorghum bicolor]